MCPPNTCFLMDKTCSKSYSGTKLTYNPATDILTASDPNNFPAGYTEEFCFKCLIDQTPNPQKEYYSDFLSVVQAQKAALLTPNFDPKIINIAPFFETPLPSEVEIYAD